MNPGLVGLSLTYALTCQLDLFLFTRQVKYMYLLHVTLRSNIEEVVKTGAGENNVHFCHLLGILKLAW